MATGTRQSKSIDLRAVILVARLQPGPRLIFHYPPDLRSSPVRDTARDDDSDSDSDSGDNEQNDPLSSFDHPDSGDNAVQNESLLSAASSRSKEPLDHTIFGYSEETLQKLLSPGCWSDRKKFELSLDRMTFVGHPIWAASDGSWTRRHSHDDGTSKQEATPPAKPRTKPHTQESTSDQENGSSKADASNPTLDFTHVPESTDSRTAGQSFATSMASESSNPGNAAEKLTMFNVIFAIGPSNNLDQQHTGELYQHVVKMLSKALHYCQRRTQYLGLESKKLLNAKVKARQDGLSDKATCQKMIETSELAWCLKEVFEKIKLGEVAGIRLSGMEMAVQISDNHISDSDTDRDLDGHSALLLLESKDTLLRDLTHPEASTLAYFIREHTPTKSLQKLANRLGIALGEIFDLASHLIKWRKARIIDPLHPRNTYIVCHDAPLGQVRSQYAEIYAKKFPVLPSLTQMLRFLGGKPIRYGMLIPSRDHRNPYMQILAFLVQHRIVEPLKTYGWLQAPTSEVARIRKVEEVNENRRPLSVASLLSPQMRPVRDDDNISVSSERTAIPVSVLESAHRRREFTSFPRADISHGNEDRQPPQIVKDPLSPSAEDQKRLQHIRNTIDDDEFQDRFPSLLRYFDGTYSFEEIAAGEGVKRAKVEAWLDALQKDGFLVTFRAT